MTTSRVPRTPPPSDHMDFDPPWVLSGGGLESCLWTLGVSSDPDSSDEPQATPDTASTPASSYKEFSSQFGFSDLSDPQVMIMVGCSSAQDLTYMNAKTEPGTSSLGSVNSVVLEQSYGSNNAAIANFTRDAFAWEVPQGPLSYQGFENAASSQVAPADGEVLRESMQHLHEWHHCSRPGLPLPWPFSGFQIPPLSNIELNHPAAWCPWPI